MKNGNIASLIAIVAIALVVMFSGCIGSKTPIHDIYENPDKYVDKEVTIMARGTGPDQHSQHLRRNSPDCSGFWISDIGKSEGSDVLSMLEPHDYIFVAYDGNIPREQHEEFKDEWGRQISRTVKVKGVVRHELLRSACGWDTTEYPCFYIEGESWEFID